MTQNENIMGANLKEQPFGRTEGQPITGIWLNG